jgi:hypothetical protein
MTYLLVLHLITTGSAAGSRVGTLAGPMSEAVCVRAMKERNASGDWAGCSDRETASQIALSSGCTAVSVHDMSGVENAKSYVLACAHGPG